MIIWRSKLKLDDDRLDDVISSVNGNPNLTGLKGMYTTYYVPSVYDRQEVEFAPDYKKILAEGLSALGLHHRCSYTFDHWMQVYGEGNVGHKPHDHYGVKNLVSWVHFVRPTLTKVFHFLDSDGNKTYPPQNEGDFIMFCPWQLHAVDPSDDLRTVIAGNVMMQELVCPDNEKTCEYHSFDGSTHTCKTIPIPSFLS